MDNNGWLWWTDLLICLSCVHTENFKAAGVKCAICGDSSHPTRDCTQKKKSAAETAALDEEYNSFMQQLDEKPVISTVTKVPTVAAAPALAPWLQPIKASSTTKTQPWMLKQSVGAPGTSSAPPPPGTHHGPTVLGATPATAYPPPVAPAGGYGYQAQPAAWGAGQQQSYQPQQQQQWGGNDYYYGGWDGNATAGAAAPAVAAPAQYSPYGPPPGAASAVPATATEATSAADYYQYQQQYYANQPQQ